MNNIAEYPVPSPTGFSVYDFSESWIFGKVSARSPTPKLMIKNSWLLFTNHDEDLRPITIVFVYIHLSLIEFNCNTWTPIEFD